ncbi:MAG TPA: hypothetical protein VLH19_05470 [Patescibacteria group bacterium]|nr:hypothetical protein [Patescibacteria group bacterium]
MASIEERAQQLADRVERLVLGDSNSWPSTFESAVPSTFPSIEEGNRLNFTLEGLSDVARGFLDHSEQCTFHVLVHPEKGVKLRVEKKRLGGYVGSDLFLMLPILAEEAQAFAQVQAKTEVILNDRWAYARKNKRR